MGAHDDPDPAFRNEDNECYCLEDEDFQCFGSGVLNMEPCKRDVKAPLALSFPHFYQVPVKSPKWILPTISTVQYSSIYRR